MKRFALSAAVAAAVLTGAASAQETVPGVGQGGSSHAGAVPSSQPTAGVSGSSTGARGQPLEGQHAPGGAVGTSGGSAGPNNPAKAGSTSQGSPAPQ
jgi:hypothetical protein